MLADGSTVRFRTINRDDVERLLDFFYRLSRHSVYLRFHHTMTHLSREEAERFCTIDYQNSFALVATITEDSKEQIVASGRYYRLPASDEAEVAFTVEDAYQKKGIGTHLLQQLAAVARQHGIRRFTADVLAENQDMIQVFEESKFPVTEEQEDDTRRIVLNIGKY